MHEFQFRREKTESNIDNHDSIRIIESKEKKLGKIME